MSRVLRGSGSQGSRPRQYTHSGGGTARAGQAPCRAAVRSAASPAPALLRCRNPAYGRRDVATAAECPLPGHPALHPGRRLAEPPPLPPSGFDATTAMVWWLFASTAASLLPGAALVWLYKAHAEATTHAGLLIQVGTPGSPWGSQWRAGRQRTRTEPPGTTPTPGPGTAGVRAGDDIKLEFSQPLPCNPNPSPALQAGGYAAAGAGLLLVGGLGSSDAFAPGAVLLLVGAVLAAAWRYWREQIQLTARLLRVSANGLAANTGLVPLVLGLALAGLCAMGPLVVSAGEAKRFAAVPSGGGAQSLGLGPLHRGCPCLAPAERPAVSAPTTAGFVLQNGELGPNPARGGSPKCVDALTGKDVPCCVFNTGGREQCRYGRATAAPRCRLASSWQPGCWTPMQHWKHAAAVAALPVVEISAVP